MPRRQNALKIILSTVITLGKGDLSYPKICDTQNSRFNDDIFNVYRALGGTLQQYEHNLRRWDLTVDGIAVELDEQLHFNRYRGITLKSGVYQELSFFPHEEYSCYCHEFENKCLRSGSYGGKWTNKNAERQFGRPSEPGVLDNGNAPRWKQRAFYDYVKDLAPLTIGVPLARIAIWDQLEVDNETVRVYEILDTENKRAANALLELIYKRTRLPR